MAYTYLKHLDSRQNEIIKPELMNANELHVKETEILYADGFVYISMYSNQIKA